MASAPNQIAKIEEAPRPMSDRRESHAIMKDKARIFAMSPLIPDSLRGNNPDVAFANCMIALELANLMNEAPLVVMQNIHIVKGKAGFSAQYMIARANASPVFRGRINWRMSGQGNTLCAEAYATLAETGEEVSFAVDMAMAQAEGWTSNPKYKSVPHLMLRYRSATFLVRLFAPDVMLGYQTTEEVEDVSYAEIGPATETRPLTAALIEQAATGEVLPLDAGPARSDDQHGELTTLESAKSEIDQCELVADVNTRTAALLPLLGESDADELRTHATDRIAELQNT